MLLSDPLTLTPSYFTYTAYTTYNAIIYMTDTSNVEYYFLILTQNKVSAKVKKM